VGAETHAIGVRLRVWARLGLWSGVGLHDRHPVAVAEFEPIPFTFNSMQEISELCPLAWFFRLVEIRCGEETGT